MRGRAILAVAAAITLQGASRVCAAPGAATAAPASPDPLSVYVMTFGPGDHPFFKFGHDALWIHDAGEGTDLVYNFGTFAFTSPRLILDFLHGRMTYWLSVSTLRPTLASYEHENRTIDVQELALEPAAKRALRARLDVNARPENRDYKYDYFLDNCATRVRDAIDAAAGGALHRSARGAARLTLRAEALRMTADYWPLYVALDIVLGPGADRPVDRWAGMFLPQELERGLAAAAIAGPAGPEPLVESSRTIFPAHRAPPLEAPPRRRGLFFLAGCTLGLLFLLLGYAAGRSAAARVLLGLLLAAWGLLAGFIGCFLVYVWAFTDHVVAHGNQNVLVFAPWALALMVLGLGVSVGWPRAGRGARIVVTAALAAVVAACLLKLGLVRHQDNVRLLAFALPTWLGVRGALALSGQLWDRARRR